MHALNAVHVSLILCTCTTRTLLRDGAGNRARSFSLTRGCSGGGPLKHHSSPLLGGVGSLH